MSHLTSPLHYKKIEKIYADREKDLILFSQASLSPLFGLNRIGVHHVTLSPGYRLSYPHAESHEEEFVYVIEGEIHAWINGFIYEMKPGWALGFPAGTGIAHTFINNSQKDVRLLVVGERTKKENLCSYPLNPEMKEKSEIWWDDYPPQKLGPHNGLPGPFDSSMIKKEVPTFAAYVPDLAPTPPFHYPGDNETFATSTRLTDVLGLKTLGIGLDVISPGRRSCYPHAHTHEEEFAFVLEGKAKVWLNGEVKEMSSGEGLAFLPGSGISHCLINDSAEPITFMGIGENRQFPDEELIYPLHPLRNKEGQRKNWYWNEAEKFPIGPHNGKPEKPIPEHLKLRLCSEQDAEEVFKILETSPEYSLKVDGCLPTLKIAKEAISSGPKKRSETYFKEFLIIEYNEKPIGVVDLYANHPEKGFTYLGLLLIGEHLFGQGLGGKCFGLVSDYVKRSFQTKTIRLGVSDDHDVSGFWKKMGFQPNGRTYSWQGETKTSNVIEYNKDL